jgi:hypothetical protein
MITDGIIRKFSLDNPRSFPCAPLSKFLIGIGTRKETDVNGFPRIIKLHEIRPVRIRSDPWHRCSKFLIGIGTRKETDVNGFPRIMKLNEIRPVRIRSDPWRQFSFDRNDTLLCHFDERPLRGEVSYGSSKVLLSCTPHRILASRVRRE